VAADASDAKDCYSRLVDSALALLAEELVVALKLQIHQCPVLLRANAALPQPPDLRGEQQQRRESAEPEEEALQELNVLGEPEHYGLKLVQINSPQFKKEFSARGDSISKVDKSADLAFRAIYIKRQINSIVNYQSWIIPRRLYISRS